MRRCLNYLPTLLVAGVIAYFSLLRSMPVKLPDWDWQNADKLVHGFFYFVFALTLVSDLHRDNRQYIITYILSFFLPIIYGGVIEWLQQYYFAPRTGEWFDWLADIAGAIAGCAVGYVYYDLCKTKRSSNT